MTDSIILTAKMPMRMEPRVLVLDTIFVLPDGRLSFIPAGGTMMVPAQCGPLQIEPIGGEET